MLHQCCQVMWTWLNERMAGLLTLGSFDGYRPTVTTEMCSIIFSKTCVGPHGITCSQCMWKVPQSHIYCDIKSELARVYRFSMLFNRIHCSLIVQADQELNAFIEETFKPRKPFPFCF